MKNDSKPQYPMTIVTGAPKERILERAKLYSYLSYFAFAMTIILMFVCNYKTGHYNEIDGGFLTNFGKSQLVWLSPAYWLNNAGNLFYSSAMIACGNYLRKLNANSNISDSLVDCVSAIANALVGGSLISLFFKQSVGYESAMTISGGIYLNSATLTLLFVGLALRGLAYQLKLHKSELEGFL